MLKRLFLLGTIATLLLWPMTVGADEPVVRLFLFQSKTCPHCRDILEDYLPGLRDKYGAQVVSRPGRLVVGNVGVVWVDIVSKDHSNSVRWSDQPSP